MTLTEFLTARLLEATNDLEGIRFTRPPHTTDCAADRCSPDCPTFIEDRIAADWAILTLHTAYNARCAECGDIVNPVSYPCPTLRWLAHPYRTHPDFDPDWRQT